MEENGGCIPLITFTIETNHKTPQELEFQISARFGVTNLFDFTPFSLSNNVFSVSHGFQLLNHPSLQIKNTLKIDIKQMIKNLNSSRKEIETSSQTSSKLYSLLNNPEFSDFKFIINEKEFNVHKCILAASSEAFMKIFKVNKSFWKINDINEIIFAHLLRFIYCEKVPENLSQIAIKLFEAADVFKIEKLKEMCSEKIHETLSVENALETYNWAFVYDLEVLKMKSWELVKRCDSDVIEIEANN